MEKRANLRRLGPLAVWGNQPATAVHVTMSGNETDVVARSILMQKVGSNPKAMKRYDEMKARKSQRDEDHKEDKGGPHDDDDDGEKLDHDDRILLRYGRVAVGAVSRWKKGEKYTAKE